MPPAEYSIEWWRNVCDARLPTAPTYIRAIGVAWLRAAYEDLEIATAQTHCHPLLRLVCAGDGTPLLAAEEAFAALVDVLHFDQRVSSLKTVTDEHQFWAKMNEVRSAALFARAGLQIRFGEEKGEALDSAPEFAFSHENVEAAVEVATLSETPERIKARNSFKNELREAVAEARRRGEGGVFGGVVHQPDRLHGGWKGVERLMKVKPGGTQLAKYRVRILHVVASTDMVTHFDFDPEYRQTHEDLTWLYSGRIFHAHYGRRGQDLFWHHLVEKRQLRTRSVSVQKTDGRFVKETSLSAAIWTTHEGSQTGSAAFARGRHVLYTPLRTTADALPVSLIDLLEGSFSFDKRVSVAPQRAELFQGRSTSAAQDDD